MSPSSNTPKRRILRFLRRLLVVSATLLVGVFLVRTFVVQGLVVPVRVVGGSMADALSGAHIAVTCQDCGFAFRVGLESPPADEKAVCPNCGCRENDVSAAEPRRGDRVLIDKASVAIRGPRRWEAVAVRTPGREQRLTVKRVVGLPGERIEIRHGDVYVDGRIAQKPFRRFREMAILVHDHDFRPTLDASPPPRWQGESTQTQWQVEEGRFRFQPKTGRETTAGEVPAEAMDWLTYRHHAALGGPGDRAAESPVMDNYGYNQGLSRELHEVIDLMLTCRITVSGSGRLWLKLHDGRSTLRAWIDVENNLAALLHGDEELARTALDSAGVDISPAAAEKRLGVEWALCDGRALLRLDGMPVFTFPLELPPRDDSFRPVSRPLGIAAEGFTVEVDQLKVYRDVYYLPAAAGDRLWSPAGPLADEELFLLGDNSPLSEDSRRWLPDERIATPMLIGRVVGSGR